MPKSKHIKVKVSYRLNQNTYDGIIKHSDDSGITETASAEQILNAGLLVINDKAFMTAMDAMKRLKDGK